MDRLRASTPRDRAIVAGAAAALILGVAVLLALVSPRQAPLDAITGPGESPAATAVAGASPSAQPSPSPSPEPTPEPSPSAIAEVPTVSSAPEAGGAGVATPVAPAATRAPATPTPSPDPMVWRVEGVVVEAGTNLPLRDVCVVIGPHGCQRGSIRTDSRGVFYIDVPQVPTVFYDLSFVKDGYTVAGVRIKPEAPAVYNVALAPR
jgi:hypothetical protein